MYKSFIRQLCTLTLVLFACSASAVPITYDFSATNITSSPYNKSGISAPDIITGSFTLDDFFLLDFDLTLGSHSYDAGEVFVTTVFDEHEVPLLYARGIAFDGFSSGNDYFDLMLYKTTLAFRSLSYSITEGAEDRWGSNTGTVTVSTQVPEPAPLLLLGIAFASLSLRRMTRKA